MTDATETTRKVISDPFKEFRIVGFNGSVDDWPKWSKKFIAVAKLNKFASYLDGSLAGTCENKTKMGMGLKWDSTGFEYHDGPMYPQYMWY